MATLHHDTRVLDVLCRTLPCSLAATAAASTSTADCSPSPPAPSSPYVLVLLNQPLDSFFKPLWENASFRVCADGGANRFYDAYATDEERRNHLPDCVLGDLDSVRPDAWRFFTSDPVARTRVLVRRDPEQESTDLDKCLAWMLRTEAAVRRMRRREIKQRNAATGSTAAGEAASAASLHASTSTVSSIVAPIPLPAVLSSPLQPSSSPPPASPSPSGVEQFGPGVCACVLAPESPASPAVSCECSRAVGRIPPSAVSFFSSSPPLSALPILLYPAFGGRFDQQTAILHALLRHADDLPHAAMLAEGNIARVLMHNTAAPTALQTTTAAAANTTMSAHADQTVPASAAANGPSSADIISLPRLPLSHTLSIHPCLQSSAHCGLFPVCGTAESVTSRGLEWDLTQSRMEWGKHISTSNRIKSEVVHISASAPMVWTSELRHRHADSHAQDAAGTGHQNIAAP